MGVIVRGKGARGKKRDLEFDLVEGGKVRVTMVYGEKIDPPATYVTAEELLSKLAEAGILQAVKPPTGVVYFAPKPLY